MWKNWNLSTIIWSHGHGLWVKNIFYCHSGMKRKDTMLYCMFKTCNEYNHPYIWKEVRYSWIQQKYKLKCQNHIQNFNEIENKFHSRGTEEIPFDKGNTQAIKLRSIRYAKLFKVCMSSNISVLEYSASRNEEDYGVSR